MMFELMLDCKTKGKQFFGLFILVLGIVPVCRTQDYGTVRGSRPPAESGCSLVSFGQTFRGSSQRDTVRYPETDAYQNASLGWLSDKDKDNYPNEPWLMVDLSSTRTVVGISSRGREDWFNDHVIQFTVQYCDETDTSAFCTSGKWEYNPGIYSANDDNNSTVTNFFTCFPFRTRTVRITAHRWIFGAAVAMRAGIVVCQSFTPDEESCQSDWFGTIADNKQLPHPTACSIISGDGVMSASSEDLFYKANFGYIDSFHSWLPTKTDKKPWFKLELTEARSIYGVVMQGRPDWTNDHVIQFNVTYCVSENCSASDAKWWDGPQLLKGNSDGTSKVTQILSSTGLPLKAIKIYPTSWIPGAKPSLRLGLVTCENVTTPTNDTVYKATCITKAQDIGCTDMQPCHVQCSIDSGSRCQLDGPPVWGTFIYSIDSPVCRAAWHVGGPLFARSPQLRIFVDSRAAAQGPFNRTTRYGIASKEFLLKWKAFTFFPELFGLPAN